MCWFVFYSARLETGDWDYKLIRKVFTELRNQGLFSNISHVFLYFYTTVSHLLLAFCFSLTKANQQRKFIFYVNAKCLRSEQIRIAW